MRNRLFHSTATFSLAIALWSAPSLAQDAPVSPTVAPDPAQSEAEEAVAEAEAAAEAEGGEEEVVTVQVQAQPTAPSSGDADEAPLDIVETIVTRRAPTKLSFKLTTKEVRTLPGAFGDAFRAVGTLPGLTPIISGLPFYYVRGAPPGNVGYRFNGIRVPTLFHVGIGPSVLQPAFVDSVELHPGAYDASLGQYSGGFITAEETPAALQIRGEANIRLFDVGGFVEAPFADGKGTFAMGGRYSYTAALLSLVAPEAVLDYSDFQVRLTYQLSPEDHLTIFSMGSFDLFGTEENDILEVNYGVEFYRLSAIHQRDYANGLWRSQVTVGYDKSIFGFDSSTVAESLNARTRYETKLAPELSLRIGAVANIQTNDTVDSKYLDPDQVGADFFESTFPSRTDSSGGLWASSTWDASQQLRISPGVRMDLYHSGETTLLATEPRLRADYSLTPSTGVIAAVGIAHQPPSFAFPIGGLTPAGLEAGLQRTMSGSLGVRTTPWPGSQASVTSFYNRFSNMTDALGASSAGGGPDTDLNERSTGYGVGLETNFTGRINDAMTGLLSYTLSRSVRSVNRRRVYSQFDRTHVLNVALNYSFGNGYSLGGRYLAYSGIPFADDDGNASVGTTPDRSHFFNRVDARFEKHWDLSATAWMSLVVEGLNVTLSSEETAPDIEGPVIAIPSIGLEGGF